MFRLQGELLLKVMVRPFQLYTTREDMNPDFKQPNIHTQSVSHMLVNVPLNFHKKQRFISIYINKKWS